MLRLQPAGEKLFTDNAFDLSTVADLSVKVVIEATAKKLPTEEVPDPPVEKIVIVTDMAEVTDIITDHPVHADPELPPIPDDVLAMFPDAKHYGEA